MSEGFEVTVTMVCCAPLNGSSPDKVKHWPLQEKEAQKPQVVNRRARKDSHLGRINLGRFLGGPTQQNKRRV